jgi:triphosphoribosyl-dephospho-CoA synthase
MDRTHSIGALAELACTWEVLARKAGNVCPGREFPDLTVADFLKSAAAIAPVLDQAPSQPLGVTILRCIEETRKVVSTNTNLGIVLLLAPLASVPLEERVLPCVRRVLEQTTVDDSRNAFAAIRLAKPGGLGDVNEQDVAGEPTLPLLEVMALARERDLIAEEYAGGFSLVELMTIHLDQFAYQYQTVERAIVDSQLTWLSLELDSLISRKHGPAMAEEVRKHAQQIAQLGYLESTAGRKAFLEFDAWLRSDNHARNPGTTADLIAAALFVALRGNTISPETSFAWHEHPFDDATFLRR